MASSDFMLDLVGVPFKEGGLNPDTGFYCYGLVRYVLGIGTGVWIPTAPIGWKKYAKVLPPTTALLRYDVLMFSEKSMGLIDHVGVCDGAGNFIHANKKSEAVVCEPVSRYFGKIVSVGRMRRAA